MMTRRQLIASAGACATTALAGCNDPGQAQGAALAETASGGGTSGETFLWDSLNTFDDGSGTGVAHEDVDFTDHQRPARVVQGYSHSRPLAPTVRLRDYPLAESSAPAHDVWNGQDAQSTSVERWDVPAAGGETGAEFGGSHRIDIPDLPAFDEYTLSAWAYIDDVNEGSLQPVMAFSGTNLLTMRGDGQGNFEWYHRDSGGWNLVAETAISSQTWYHVAQTWDGSTVRAWLNGVEQGTYATGGIDTSGRLNDWLGYAETPNEYLYGRLAQVQFWDAQVDVAAHHSYAVTADYEASARELTVDRDGNYTVTVRAGVPSTETLELTMHEDTDADGVAENSTTVAVPDGESTHDLGGFSTSAGDVVWWSAVWNPNEGGDLTQAAHVRKVEVAT